MIPINMAMKVVLFDKVTIRETLGETLAKAIKKQIELP